MRAFLIGLTVVAVLAVAGVVALGYTRAWFTVNGDKIKEDTDDAKGKVQELGKQIKDKAQETVDKTKERTGTKPSSMKTAAGKVKQVEPADHRFFMTTSDNTELTVYTNQTSALRMNDRQVRLEDFQIGDEVKVEYDLKDGQDLATSVTVSRK